MKLQIDLEKGAHGQDKKEGESPAAPPRQDKQGKSAMALLGVVCMIVSLSLLWFRLNSYALLADRRDLIEVHGDNRTVILISIDGFRYDFIHRGLTPNLARLADEGVMMPLKPQFPSYTFPNHFTLVTGRYPAWHGIVGNSFHDPISHDSFHYTNKSMLDPRWWNAEPIWNAAERQGMTAAIMFWPGSEVPIGGHRPDRVHRYDGSISNADRVRHVMRWIDGQRNVGDKTSKKQAEITSPRFVAMYFSAVDHAGHMHGTRSRAVRKALKKVDAAIGMLRRELEERDLLSRVNLVIVSDHGMADVKQRIDLDRYWPELGEHLEWADWGPVASFHPKVGRLEKVHAKLLEVCADLPVTVYKREELPAHFKYHSNVRIAPLLIVSEVGYTVDLSTSNFYPRGNHGYDPTDERMNAILIAHGPKIISPSQPWSLEEAGHPIPEAIENVEVYPFIADLMEIEPMPSNGTGLLSNLVVQRL